MNKRSLTRWVWIASCVVLLMTLAGRLFAQTASTATLTPDVRIIGKEGKVEVLRSGAQTWDLAYTNLDLYAGDRLRVPERGRVSLMSSDRSVARFGELSAFTIQPPAAAKKESGFSLSRGLLYFFHRGKPADVQIKTRTAAAAVRGTEFNLEVEESGRTILTMLDGEVELSNDRGPINLQSGEQGIAEPGKAPTKTAIINPINIIQWALYYSAVLDLDELNLSPAERQLLEPSLAAYRSGDLLRALAEYPAGRTPESPAEKVYLGALLLAVGQVERTEKLLESLPRNDVQGATNNVSAALAEAIRQLVAAVKLQPWQRSRAPELATEWLAESYYHQSLADLPQALQAARSSVERSPNFGFGWARVAELEFSFGRIREAVEALEKSLELAPRNPEALALKGFLLGAQNRIREAITYFEQAMAVDAALGNAWLGRGLCRIRQGKTDLGRKDLLVAAALEPQRALLRSYLGKAYGDTGDTERALRELRLAKQLDPDDPTAWLYSALVNEQQNHLNQAVDDLERSKELNDNRLLYRSRLLLDQDRAIRAANLARIYADAGLEEVAVREAARSVAADYGNYSAHYFLANSFNALRRANPSDLRFETGAFSEYLLANLMGPAEGSLLAQPISQQEYTRLFERDYFGFSSSTEYLSRGAWTELAVQYGTFRNSSYALEVDYLWDPGQAPNASFEQKVASASFKQMLTPKDGVYLEVLYFSQVAEDIGRKYDPDATVAGLRTREKQEPTLLAGFDHQWDEANRTLFLAGHINDSLRQANPYGSTYLLQEIFGNPIGFVPTALTQEYENRLTVDSFELQHIARSSRLQTIAGIRFQNSVHRVSNLQTLEAQNASGLEIYFGQPGDVIINQSLRLNGQRISPYFYEHWQVTEPLWLIGGVSYDYQEQPRNIISAPLSDEHDYVDQFSPKAALIWTPTAHSAVRAAYTRSLTGVSLEQSVRLEPSQLAGFVQGYRDIIPAPLSPGLAGSRVETADLSLEYRFPTRTYIALGGQLLRSGVEHDVGVFQRDLSTSAGPGIQTEEKLRYQERSLDASVHQLLADWFSVGLRYRLSDARLQRTFPGLDPALAGSNNHTSRGLLHTLSLQPLVRHPTGFFAGAKALWWSQQLSADLTNLPEDQVWQVNLFAGYRSPRRRVEITMGVLNVTDHDYRIHPINLYAELPRERTFFTRLQLSF